MENLEQEFLIIHQESIWREVYARQALKQIETHKAPLVDRASTSLGNLLIRMGTKLKERAYTKLTTEEASSPSFLIML